jgi:hypothetical protein
VSAFESIAEKDYSPAMVFAQSAVEISVMPAIARRLQRHASNDAVSEFVKGNLSYGHALNIVLPYLCGELAIPKMPDSVRGPLNRLRRRRNEIIHSGVRSQEILYDEAVAGITAAVFGFEYMRFAAPLLA